MSGVGGNDETAGFAFAIVARHRRDGFEFSQRAAGNLGDGVAGRCQAHEAVLCLNEQRHTEFAFEHFQVAADTGL